MSGTGKKDGRNSFHDKRVTTERAKLYSRNKNFGKAYWSSYSLIGTGSQSDERNLRRKRSSWNRD